MTDLPPKIGLGMGVDLRVKDRLHNVVSGALESKILNGELQVGDKLPSESELAKDFGVSTRSVREAIQALEVKGLVQRRHGERTTVVRGDVDEYLGTLAVTVRQKFASDPEYLIQLMVARRMIETEVVGLVCASDKPVHADVSEAMDRMRQARDADDFSAFVEADAAFHLALAHSCGNKILAVMYDNLFGLINEVIKVSSRVPTKSLQAACQEHEAIYLLLKGRNSEGAKALMRSQIDNSADYLRIAIGRSDGSISPA